MEAAAGVEFKCCCSAHIVPHSAFRGLILKSLVKKRSFFACVLYGDLKVLSKMHKIQAIYKMPKKFIYPHLSNFSCSQLFIPIRFLDLFKLSF